MGFLRLILIIMFFSALSLAGLVALELAFPEAFATGWADKLLAFVAVSLMFLFFLKKHRKGSPSEAGKEPRPEGTSEAAARHSSDGRLEEVRDRIRDRKRPKE
jgi:hypothetical protein